MRYNNTTDVTLEYRSLETVRPVITVQGDARLLLLQFGLLRSEYMTGNYRERCVGVCTAGCAQYETATAGGHTTVQHLLWPNSSSCSEYPALT